MVFPSKINSETARLHVIRANLCMNVPYGFMHRSNVGIFDPPKTAAVTKNITNGLVRSFSHVSQKLLSQIISIAKMTLIIRPTQVCGDLNCRMTIC